jgi:F-type H+-transporting ATPase subunit delta
MAPLAGASTTRAFGTSAMRSTTEAQQESIAAFKASFEKHKPIPTMDNPSTPSAFMKPAKEMPTSMPEKMTLNFYMPHEIQFNGAEVGLRSLLRVSGQMGRSRRRWRAFSGV